MLTMKLIQEINNTRDMIDGDLNRIMITDDIEEIRRLTYYLFLDINDLIRKNQQRIAKSLRCEESEIDINE
ncbi:unknown [Clostridium sp. CAG:964]|nr:unknown [Clostridium sp. CAG:964]